MLRSLCFVSLNLPACHICSTQWLLFIYLTWWCRQLKWRRDENAHLSEAKHHLSILISVAEMPTPADMGGENSGDFVCFNSPNSPAKKKKKKKMLCALSQHPSVCSVACMHVILILDVYLVIFEFYFIVIFYVAICSQTIPHRNELGHVLWPFIDPPTAAAKKREKNSFANMPFCSSYIFIMVSHNLDVFCDVFPPCLPSKKHLCGKIYYVLALLGKSG